MTPELSQRLAAAVNRGARIEERRKIQEIFRSDVKYDKFSDLPNSVQALVRELETRPKPKWASTRKVKK